MRSSIKFDLDGENNPIIVVKYVESDDLRDKVVKRFSESFQYASNWCNVEFIRGEDGKYTNFIISPIGDRKLPLLAEEVKVRSEWNLSFSPDFKKD